MYNFFLNLKLQSYNKKNSLIWSNFDRIASISLHLSYEYFNNQATGPGSGPGPGLKRDWDREQSLGPGMTGAGTNLREQK